MIDKRNPSSKEGVEMNGCPQSVVDGFKVVVDQLQELRRWFEACPLGKPVEDVSDYPLAKAVEWVAAGMQGISDWADEKEYDNENRTSRDEVHEMIREADFISTDDYDPDDWLTRDECDERIEAATDEIDADTLKEEVGELERTVAGLEEVADKVETISKPDRSELINLLVEALHRPVGFLKDLVDATQGSIEPKPVATDVRYELAEHPAVESKCEVDQVPDVHGPLLAPAPESEGS